MGKYKDALIEVSKDCKGYAMEWGFGKCACSESLQLLKELVMEKELKIELEEVKKEWEEVNCEWMETDRHIFIHSKESFDGVTFPTIALLYKNSKTYTSQYHINIEIHKLLNKTLKALGWFDNE